MKTATPTTPRRSISEVVISLVLAAALRAGAEIAVDELIEAVRD